MKKIFLAIPAATIIGICFAAQVNSSGNNVAPLSKSAESRNANLPARLPVLDPGPIDPIDPVDPSAEPTVYAAGTATGGANCQDPSSGRTPPTMWINGQVIALECDYTSLTGTARGISTYQDPATGAVSVYVAGQINFHQSPPRAQAVVWQDGIAQVQSCNIMSGSSEWCGAYAVHVSDDGVQYVAGVQDMAYRPAVWINGGQPTAIDNGIYVASPVAVVENNGSLFVAGSVFLHNQPSHTTVNNPIQSAWLNVDGLKLAVSPSEPAGVTGLAVRDGVAYISGYTYNASTNRYRAAYWVYDSAQGGTPVKYNMPLPAAGISSFGTGVDLDENGIVYISGYERPINGGNSRARLWRNAISQPIQSSFVTNSVANAIRVHNGVIYLGGQISNRPAIWKNGTPEMYPGSAQAAFNTQGTIYAIDVR
jgi:hypothetical protein